MHGEREVEGVECACMGRGREKGWRVCVYGRGGVYVLREREDVYTGVVDCMYMEGLECTMHGDREDVYIRKGWSVNARREGRCVHMKGVECVCMARGRMKGSSVRAWGEEGWCM